MHYTAFLFDFDFTLADAAAGIVTSANYALNKMGLAPQDSEPIKKTIGLTLKDAFFTLTGLSDEALSKQFISFFIECADKVMTENTRLFPDTIHTLTELKSKGFKTGIVTSKHHYRISEVLQAFGIVDLVDLIIGFEDVAAAKPSPEGVLKAVNYFSVNKSNVLFIGDSLIDANAAANASVDFAAVTTGTTARSEFEPFPHKTIVRSLTELLAWLK